MRILVWNMARRARAWDWLRGRSDVEVALLQEASDPPDWARREFRFRVWQPKHAARRRAGELWGSAVLARTLELEPYRPTTEFPWLSQLAGSTAIARTAGEPRWLASVHLHDRQIPADVLAQIPIRDVELTAPKKGGGFSVWEPNVIPHELHRLFGGETFVWGGDFNTDPRMDDFKGFAGGNRRMFEIFDEVGSRDTRARFHSDYVQTFFRKSNRLPWQLDHVFADSVTEARVTAWMVDPTPATGDDACSDHAPIIVDVAT